MSKKVLIISTSPRKGGNSDRLADEFLRGAEDAGNEVEKINLYDKNINFCKGCLACLKLGNCVIKDDVNAICDKALSAEVMVFATPIYYFEMCGQMKTLLDRLNPLYNKDYAFRDFYLLSSAAEDEEGVDSRAISGLEGFVECFPKASFKASVFAGGVAAVGDIKGHKALSEAYELGKTV